MKRIIAGFIFVVALAAVPWALATGYMKSAGIVVTGKVTTKREMFLLPGGDTSRHI